MEPSSSVVKKRATLTTVAASAPTATAQTGFVETPIGPTKYDHLLHWDTNKDNGYVGEDDALDSDGTLSGEDNGDELAPGEDVPNSRFTAMEVEAAVLDIEHTRKSRGKISEDKVVKIINEYIEQFEQQWFPEKIDNGLTGKKWEESIDPVLLWENAEREGRRQALIEHWKSEVEHFKGQIDMFAQEVLEWAKNSVADVRKRCMSLEIPVENLRAAQWYLSIYELPEEYSEGNLEGDSDGDSDGDVEMLESGSKTISPERRRPGIPEVIDLGSSDESSDEEDMIIENCSPAGPVSPKAPPQVKPMALHGSRPEDASIQSVAEWDLQQLIDGRDRKRIVQKLMLNMSYEREVIRHRMKIVQKQNTIKDIRAYIHMLRDGQGKIPGVLPDALRKIRALTRFFLSWWFIDDCFKNMPSKERIRSLADNYDGYVDQVSIFHDWLWLILLRVFPEGLALPVEEATMIDSDDEGDIKSEPSMQAESPRPNNVQPSSTQPRNTQSGNTQLANTQPQNTQGSMPSTAIVIDD